MRWSRSVLSTNVSPNNPADMRMGQPIRISLAGKHSVHSSVHHCKKSILVLICGLIVTTCLTGCFKRDKMEDINIITTIYPIEYVTNRLYGNNSSVESIYPRNAVSSDYTITSKQLKDYSKYDLFIYNGESSEREYATKMLDNNNNLKIID